MLQTPKETSVLVKSYPSRRLTDLCRRHILVPGGDSNNFGSEKRHLFTCKKSIDKRDTSEETDTPVTKKSAVTTRHCLRHSSSAPWRSPHIVGGNSHFSGKRNPHQRWSMNRSWSMRAQSRYQMRPRLIPITQHG